VALKQASSNIEIPPEVMRRLQEQLAKPQGFKSYSQIQQWLLLECNVDVAYQTVHAYVRYKLKGKPKVPRPRSQAATPAVQEAFKKTLAPLCR